jgi:hypothetical protein
MAEIKNYTVNRSMHGDGRDYARGDTRKMTVADAAVLLASGALSEEGADAVTPEPAVRHTFGTEPSAVADRGYTTPTGDGVIVGTPPAERSLTPAKASALKPGGPPARAKG